MGRIALLRCASIRGVSYNQTEGKLKPAKQNMIQTNRYFNMYLRVVHFRAIIQ
jgi:hypothetical protein